MFKEFRISLDLESSKIINAVNGIVQNDSGTNKFIIDLVWNNKPFDITEATLVTFTVLKPNKTHYIDSSATGGNVEILDAEKGRISVVLADTNVSQAGMHNATIEIYNGENKMSSARFSYNVVGDLAEGSDPSSDSNFPILQQLVQQVSDKLEDMSDIEEAEELRVTAEETRVTAENDRITAENNRVTAETNRETAETSRVSSETSRATAETSRANAEISRASAETSRVNAETSRASAETSRVQAEQARNVFEDYNSSKAYKVNNKVFYQGSSYVCISNTTAGTLPTDTSHWKMIAKKGDTGDSSHITASKSDGITTLTITDTTGTSTVTILDGTNGTDGTDGVDGADGVSPTASVNKSGTTSTLTVTDANGTTSVEIEDGDDGTDGISPTISTNKVGKTTTLTITDVNGTHTATIMDGADGAGSGDMRTSIYDTHNKAQDIFDYIDNKGDGIIKCTVDYDNGRPLTITFDKAVDFTKPFLLFDETDMYFGNNMPNGGYLALYDFNYSESIYFYLATDEPIGTNTYSIALFDKFEVIGDWNIDDYLSQVTDNVSDLQGDVSTIKSKIPDEASSSNKLADKNFVNSSISTNTATFRGNFNSVAELQAYSGDKTNNDYAYVKTTGTDGLAHVVRYKYNGTSWTVEFDVNNSIFTAQQFAWLNTVADGTTIVNNNGILRATAQTPSIATTSNAGIVKPDGTTIHVTADGKISSPQYTLPQATTNTLGGVKVDGTTIVSNNGVISASSSANVEAIKESEFTTTYKNNMQNGSIAIVVKNI